MLTFIDWSISDHTTIQEWERFIAPLPGTRARAAMMDVDLPLQPRDDPPRPRKTKAPGENIANLVDEEQYPRKVKKCRRTHEPVEEVRWVFVSPPSTSRVYSGPKIRARLEGLTLESVTSKARKNRVRVRPQGEAVKVCPCAASQDVSD